MLFKRSKNDSCITDQVIETTFDQIAGIGVLNIAGGEPTLVLDCVEKVISYIIKQQIPVEDFTVTINGTVYSVEFLRLLDEISCYIGDSGKHTLFAISIDKYHKDEVKRLGILEEWKENLIRYSESKYFYDFRYMTQKMFREGNAVYLDQKLTVPLRPMKTVMTYVKNGKLDIENGLCHIAPFIAINPNGIVTECNASIEHQETIYNYGNVLTESIEDIYIRNGAPILKPKQFEREASKILKKYLTYDK